MLFSRRRYFIELLHVVVIISILIVLAVKSYQVVLVKAEVMGMIARFETVKTGSAIYFALHGEFPQNAEQVFSLLPPESPYRTASEMKVVVEQGAVSVSCGDACRHLAGTTLTMRPVVQDDDPAGAAHWVCVRQQKRKRMADLRH